MLNVLAEVVPAESVTVISIFTAEYNEVGVPLNKPELLRNNPVGKVPEVSCQLLYVPLPPVAVN